MANNPDKSNAPLSIATEKYGSNYHSEVRAMITVAGELSK